MVSKQDKLDKSNLKDPKMDDLEDMNFHLCKSVVLSIFWLFHQNISLMGS